MSARFAVFYLALAALIAALTAAALMYDRLPKEPALVRLDASSSGESAPDHEARRTAIRLNAAVRAVRSSITSEEPPLDGQDSASTPDSLAPAHVDAASGSSFESFMRILRSGLSSWSQEVESAAAAVIRNVARCREITVAGAYYLAAESMLEKAGISCRKWLWENNPEASRRRLLENPWIDDAAVTYQLYPAKLHVVIEEAEPWLVAELSQGSWLVSNRGRLLSRLDAVEDSDLVLKASELVRLTGLREWSGARSYLDSEIARFEYAATMLMLLEMAGGVPMRYEQVELTGDGALRILPEDEHEPRVVLAVQTLGEAERALHRLRVVRGDLQKRDETAAEIDLRFANQAVIKRS